MGSTQAQRLRLGEQLIASRLLSDEKLELALKVCDRTKERLGSVLERMGFVRPEDIARMVSRQYGVRYISPKMMSKVKLDAEALEKLGEDFAKENDMVPVLFKKRPLLIMYDLLNTKAKDRSVKLIGKREVVLSTKSAIATALALFSFAELDANSIVEQTRDTIAQGEINELLTYLLGRAVLVGTSDIHIEPSGPVSMVRFRRDGVLMPELTLPRERHENLVNVLFGKSGIDLSDFHRLRDGRFSFEFAGRNLDVRFASSPTVEGPMVVMRILDDTRSLMRLEELGYSRHNLNSIAEILRHPYGVILMVGPTGSGKTTTLYSMLSTLNDSQRKILTVEDPVEIKLPSVQQVQVNDKAGVTFANAVRGFLRQDPDIILVGEIRDEETAREAYRAANTGHLVFSTLHANTAMEAFGRLTDLGLEAFRLADGTVGVVAQRLLRRLCQKCSKPEKRVGFERPRKAGDGCAACSKGYVGRSVVAEVLKLSPELIELVHHGRPASELLAKAMKEGFMNMLVNGCFLIDQGQTSVEEVERVIGPYNELILDALVEYRKIEGGK